MNKIIPPKELAKEIRKIAKKQSKGDEQLEKKLIIYFCTWLGVK